MKTLNLLLFYGGRDSAREVLDRTLEIPPPSIRINRFDYKNILNHIVKNDNDFLYGITLTFKNKIKYIDGTIRDFESFESKKLSLYVQHKVETYFKRRNSPVIEIILFPEYGSTNLRLHYHGIIYGYPREVNRFRTWWYNLFGKNKFEGVIYNISSWVKYITKDINKNTMNLIYINNIKDHASIQKND